MKPRMRLHIRERSSFAGGHCFGPAGAYETLVGRLDLAVDPEAPPQETVVDLERAPRNAEGMVEFATDFVLLKPVDPEKGNRRLLFEFVNRGHNRTLQTFNGAPGHHCNRPRTIEDAGDGFLLRRGYSLVWAAWQGDILPGDDRLLLTVPVATDNGRPITGRVRSEFIAHQPGIRSFPLSGYGTVRSYPVAAPDRGDAVFTCRQYPWSERFTIPPDKWQFARLEPAISTGTVYASGHAVVPSATHVFVPAGFQPGWIYELIYTARDPLVLGLGYVAIRELISFLKYGTVDSAGTPNPLGEEALRPETAYCVGRSQSGRVIRDFIYLGFNADSQGRRVFDGAYSHVAGAGRMALNHRWAQPVRLPSFQHEEHYTYADRFPFSYARSVDHLTGATDAILKRPETDPLIIHTQSSTEYWQRHGSLVHTDTRGNDLPQPDTVRIYLLASAQHWPHPRAEQNKRGLTHHFNIISTMPLFRSMLELLDRWATDGTPPPSSRIPTRTEGTLVTIDEWRAQFPRIPGIVLPREPNRLPLYDYGPDADRGYISSEPPQPPAHGEEYPILVPAVDRDGNDIPGIRMPLVQAPVGTYTGWNIRARGYSPGDMASGTGSYIPFPTTAAECEALSDPRVPLEARYGSGGAFLEAVAEAARRLAAEGFLLLEEDLDEILADARWAWRAGTSVLETRSTYF